MKKILTLILFFLFSITLFAKGIYIVTLKSGRKIKADAVVKYDGYVKVFKFGGYIIYPSKNVKSIEYVSDKEIKNINDNSSKKDNKISNNCSLKVKNFEAKPFFNKDKGLFNVEVKGIIQNNCEDTFTDVKLDIQFMDKNRNLIAKKVITIEEILPMSDEKFNQIYNDLIADNISYYLYKLEYLREK